MPSSLEANSSPKHTSNVSYTTTSSSTHTTSMQVCPADGNIFVLEKSDKKRKYCSDDCRYKIREIKKNEANL